MEGFCLNSPLHDRNIGYASEIGVENGRQMRKKKTWACLGVAIVVLFSLPVFDHLMSEPMIRIFGDSMDWRSRCLMGLRGIDCGRVKLNGDPKAATACALKAQTEGKPFRVRYDIWGYDSAVAAGVARTPSGEVYAISYDGDPSGQGGSSLLTQRSGKSPCPKPYRLWVNPKGRVNCFQKQLSYPKSLMSPNSEPY